MSSALINRSPDLKRLLDEGYEIEVRAGHLLVHSIPYVNANREVARGVLVSHLTLAGEVATTPQTHVAYFIGDQPCHADGSPIVQISLDENPKPPVAAGIPVRQAFSNKPAGGYSDYYSKMTRYIQIISAPAQSIDPDATAITNKVIPSVREDSVFHYTDSASSRSGIGRVSGRLAKSNVAIVGLGGTGSYVLDVVAKTWVKEIHLFDGDRFLQHNAFRAPGAASLEELQEQRSKVDYYSRIYSKMRKGIVPHGVNVMPENLQLLGGMSFVFLCIDKGTAKEPIIDYLLANSIPFVDVGMGIHVVPELDTLIGTLRVTAGTADKHDHIQARISYSNAGDADEYAQNIQIADLNAMNAMMAVIKWKKICGFYQDVKREHHMTYSVNVNQLLSEDKP